MKRCCCFSLRTGGIIIGVLDLIESIILTITCICMLAIFAVGTPEQSTDILWNISNTNTTEDSELSSESKDHVALQFVVIILTVFFYIMTIVSVTQIVIASILLHGIRKRTPSFVKVWLIFKIVFLVVCCLTAIFILLAWGVTIQTLVEEIITVLINIFFLKVIYDLHKEMLAAGQAECGHVQFYKDEY